MSRNDIKAIFLLVIFVLVVEKKEKKFLIFFIQLRSYWVDSLLYLVKVRFVFSAWALQQFNKNGRCVVTVSAWTIKKLSVIKSDIRICVEKLPRIIFKFELLHCSFGILLVFVYVFSSSCWFLDLCRPGLFWYSHCRVKWGFVEWRPECQAAPLITATQLLVPHFLQW